MCDRKVPYADSERGKMFKLAMAVAEKGHRPKIRESWNPAVSYLITTCWAGDPSVGYTKWQKERREREERKSEGRERERERERTGGENEK